MENLIKDYLSMLDQGRRVFILLLSFKILFIILGFSFFFLHKAELFAKGWVVLRELQVIHFFLFY